MSFFLMKLWFFLLINIGHFSMNRDILLSRITKASCFFFFDSAGLWSSWTQCSVL